MIPMDQPTIDALKELFAWVGGGLGTLYTGWKLGTRQARPAAPPSILIDDGSGPVVYSGPPDDTPRRITRKEWHDNLEKHHVYDWRWELLKIENARRDQDILELRNELQRVGREHAEAMENFIRLEEQIKAFITRWLEGVEHAKADRVASDLRTTGRFDQLERMIDSLRKQG